MQPPVDPILLQIGPFTLRWYGVLIVTGILIAAWVAARYVERKGQNGDAMWDLLLWILIPGLIGARLYYVFIQSPRGPDGLGYYLSNPWAILQIWTGGIHIFGAFIFGGIAALIYTRRHNLPPLIYPASTLFQPLFLYESLWNFIGFGLLFWISRRFEDSLRPGDLFLLYLIWYPLGRFMLEFLRTDSWFFPGTPFNMVHLLAGAAIIVSVVLLIVRHSRPALVEAQS